MLYFILGLINLIFYQLVIIEKNEKAGIIINPAFYLIIDIIIIVFWPLVLLHCILKSIFIK